MSAARTRRQWGWYQLADDAARALVAEAQVRKRDLVLDVGAGTGTITAQLIAVGARVIAVELHPRRAALLRERFANAPVTVVQADARDLRLPRRPFHVVANPPFGVTSPLLQRLLNPRGRLQTAHLVLPRGAARRWEQEGQRSHAGWAATFDVQIAHSLSRSAFIPRPQVDVVVVRVQRRTMPRRA